MKRVCEMSVEELAAVEDVDALVAYEAMHQGVPKPLMEEVPDPIAIPDKRDIGYKLRGMDVVFMTLEGAQSVVALIEKLQCRVLEKDWQSDMSYPDELLTSDSYKMGIEKVRGYSLDEKIAYSVEARRAKAVQKEIEDVRKRNEDANNQYGNVVRNVEDAIDSAKRKIFYLDGLRKQFDEYVSMANGDKSMAAAFFEKTFAKVDEEDRDAVLGDSSPRHAISE